MNNRTFKPADIIGDCIRWDKAKRDAENIPADMIEKKKAEIYPPEYLETKKREVNDMITALFDNIAL